MREPLLTFAAGAGATAAMMGASRAVQSPVMDDLQQLAATMVAPRGSAAGAVFGFASQLLNGGVFAQAYAAIFDGLRLEPGWRPGLAVGLLHGAAAGVFLGAVPPLHPRVPERIAAPGAFMRHRGSAAPIALIALHGLYGALVGSAIAATRQRHSRAGAS
jgi:hypothetical protein